MTAIASLPLPSPAFVPRPRPTRPTRPAPRPASGPARSATTGRRGIRSIVVGLVVAAVVVAAAFLATSPPLDASRAPAVVGTHVVAEGESMWTIARAHAPAGEAAGYVERLVDANGGARVRPGQELVLPVP